MANNIIDTQDVIESAQQYAANIVDTQDAIESAQQYPAALYDTQDVIEIFYTAGASPNLTMIVESVRMVDTGKLKLYKVTAIAGAEIGGWRTALKFAIGGQ